MSAIRIGDRLVGAGQPAMLVAEIGINHNGDLNLARRMIAAAAGAGADAVKFQNYRTDDFVRDRSLTYTYRANGREVTESQYAMFRRCELTGTQLAELKGCCDKHGVIFHSTPTSEAGIDDLVELGASVLKNGSDYLTHLPLVRAMGASGLPTVLSTGMATLAEVAEAVEVFCATGNRQLVLLHCTSAYPTPPADVHLRKMTTFARAFGCPVGLSDHTEGVVAAIGAVALGACWIEKHFTLDKALPGPDHAFSADPAEFGEMVAAVRTTEAQLGNSQIDPAASERPGRRDFRLSCVAARELAADHRLEPGDIVFARPGTGLPPSAVEMLIGRRARRGLRAGEVVAFDAVE